MVSAWQGFGWTAQLFTSISTLDVLVIVLYFLLVLGIALWVIVSCSRGTAEDFFLAGRNLVWWQIGAFLFASNIGTGHFMGLAGKGVSSGIAVGAFEWNAAFILCALGWVFSPVYMKSGVVTLPRYLRKRFGGYRIQLLLAVLYLLIYIFSKISVEICTGAVFMRLVLGLDVYLASVVLLSVTGIYSITGGFAAVVYTDILHASFMVLGSVFLMVYDKVACVVPSECKKYCGIQASCSPIAYPLLMVELLPSGVRGLVVSALWASLMSSLTAVFSSASAVFTMDIYPQIRPTATRKELMITGRFFVIVLLAVSIAWVPALQVAHREQLFEYMHSVLSYLTPPVAAMFLLAIFCKRVTEQGAFWGLASGLVIGSVRMLTEFAYGPWSCSVNRRCPRVICGVHYLYFALILFTISLLTVLGVSAFTEPIPDKHLHRLCWSLRNSQEERVDLDEDTEVKSPEPQAEPDMFVEDRGCLWKAWDVFCGLESLPSPKLAPEEVVVPEAEQDDVLEGPAHGATSEGPEQQEVLEEQLLWSKVLGFCGLLLLLLTGLCHVYFY
uniref:Uncharacterized protein n=1 Tax=Ovis aries TaxID=9940 RepID=A0AC11CSE9_SHEEP